ncbi:MAG: alcohol dehydrogenase catalytic domain-containing protein [Halioglobus sp.]|nr:alcohol dehydrogenase catalytic domain-containing protein [Halioglobus sp.]
MKAIKVENETPQLVDVPEPTGTGVDVKIVSASICGSDIHMMSLGAFGDHVIGHEFSGITKDGKAVAIETLGGCGDCHFCSEGSAFHCESGFSLMGVNEDGGMAESINVPAERLLLLPSGLDVRTACLIEPLAVAVHGVSRSRARQGERVLIIGAGAIGLAAGAVLRSRNITYDVIARYDHQKHAAETIRAGLAPDGHYDLVIDAVGSSASLQKAVQFVRPVGRITLLGVFWEAVELTADFCGKEPELISSTGYHCGGPDSSFREAAKILHQYPDLATALVTHRFPLDGVAEAFATAANRTLGAIKVVFDISTP